MDRAAYTLLSLILVAQLTGCTSAGRKTGQSPAEKTGSVKTTANDKIEEDFLRIGFDLMKSDSIGPVKIGMKAGVLVKEPGKPDRKSQEEMMGADGKMHQSWKYTAKGMELLMVRNGNVQEVDGIIVTAPCRYVTARGIGIGSSRGEVKKGYAAEIDTAETAESSGDSIVAGTVYGGIIFSLDEKGRVNSIFIGAAAE